MEQYGLLGFPLKHSFSKKFFTDKFLNENRDATYINFEISDIAELKNIIDTHPNLKGLNVTIPYKEQVIPLLDNLSPEAEAIGAVNVIQIKRTENDIHLKGFNSDIIGFKKSIAPLLLSKHQNALILGTGGASKAVVVGLKQLGIKTKFVSRKKKDNMLTYEELTPEIISQYQIIVNCTPCGMFPHTEECPSLPYDVLTSEHLLYDLIYNPEETLFLKKGREQGAVIKNGLEMLHLQALASWEFWNS